MPDSRTARPGKLSVLRDIFRSPAFIAVFVAIAVVYYLIIKYVITISSRGIFLVSVPIYLLYILSVTSSLLLTCSLYEIHLSYKYRVLAVGDGAASVITTFAGSLVTSCGCSAPLLATILYGLGANVIGVSGAIAFIAVNEAWLLGIVVAVNLILVYHSLGKISRGCVIRKGRIEPVRSKN